MLYCWEMVVCKMYFCKMKSNCMASFWKHFRYGWKVYIFNVYFSERKSISLLHVPVVDCFINQLENGEFLYTKFALFFKWAGNGLHFFFVLCVNLPSLLTGETQKSSRKPLRYYASDGGKPQCLEYSEIWLYYSQTAIIILNNGLQPWAAF